MDKDLSNKVDIVMTAYNAEEYISDQIESILRQTFTSWRLIITDDFSTDGTYNIAKGYAKRYPNKILAVRNKKNLRVNKNFEAGLRHVVAPLIAMCDVDDFWLPDKLFNQYKFMESNPDINLCHHDLAIADDKLNIINQSYRTKLGIHAGEKPEKHAFEYLLNKNFITSTAMMFRSDLLKYVVPLPALFVQDYWVALVASAHGKIFYLPRVEAYYRQRNGSMQGADIKNWNYYMQQLINASYGYDYLNSSKGFQQALNCLKNQHISDQNLKMVQSRIDEYNLINKLLSEHGLYKSTINIARTIFSLKSPNTMYNRFILIYFTIFKLLPKRKVKK